MEIPSEALRASYDKYVEAWSPVDPARRLELLRACVSEDCMYADNFVETQGPDGLAAVMANFQRKTPQGYFVVDSFFVQHDRALVRWRAMDGAGAVRFPSIEAVIFGPDRRLAQISGFFETLAGTA